MNKEELLLSLENYKKTLEEVIYKIEAAEDEKEIIEALEELKVQEPDIVYWICRLIEEL